MVIINGIFNQECNACRFCLDQGQWLFCVGDAEQHLAVISSGRSCCHVTSRSPAACVCLSVVVVFIWFLSCALYSRFVLRSVCVCVSQQGRECVSQLRGAEWGGLTDSLSACLSKGQRELSSSNPPHTTGISHCSSMPILWIICCQGNFTLTHTRGPCEPAVCVCSMCVIVCVYTESN